MIEIERKFLLTALPADLEEGTLILQGYLTLDECREVRIRQKGNQHFLTFKEGAGLVRRELETALTPQQFETLWPATEGRRLEKIRSLIRYNGYEIELDRYLGDLAPLLVAEVEFSSVEESERFVKPDYLGQEVTNDESYKNFSLAVHGIRSHQHP